MIGEIQPQDLYLKNTMAPNKSGIYFFQDAEGEIVYIGKAKSLRDRISQYLSDYYYFHWHLSARKGKSNAYSDSDHNRLIIKRLEKIKYASFDCSQGNSVDYEKELIAKHNPKYNCTFSKDLTKYCEELNIAAEELKTHFCYDQEKEMEELMEEFV